MNAKLVPVVFAVLALLAIPAWADWDLGDSYKMHWPQLPDPNGYDVSFTNGPLGDDWRCSESGIVNDIHLWLSFRNDFQPGPETFIGGFVEIWSNVPENVDAPFSHPGELLWGMPVDTLMPNVKLRWYEDGEQRWLEPGSTVIPDVPDHFNTYQLNIAPIGGQAGLVPFYQTEGEIYWLVSHLMVDDPTGPANVEIGWKTTLRDLRFMDDAVYPNPFGADPMWLPLEDPLTGESLDLAFVITVPEPTTVVLVLLGAVGIIAATRRRRR